MSLVAVGSVHASPGATTLAVAMASSWNHDGRAALLVEADPDGGVLAARFGLATEPGLTGLAGRARRALDHHDLIDATQHLPGGLGVVLADPSSDSTVAALTAAGTNLARGLAGVPGTDVIIDVGRLRIASAALALVASAERLVLVARPRVEEIAAVSRRLASLAEIAPLGLVLVGERPYGRREVEAALDVEVLGVVPDDRRGAAALGGGSSTRRSPLLRATASIVEVVVGQLTQTDELSKVGAAQ